MRTVNLAGRAGRWSAAHWKTAAFGWIAFGVIAVVVGGAVGATQMKDWAIANGESRRAEQILDQGSFKIPARESVLVQSKTLTVDQPAFAAAVGTVVITLSHQADVARIVSPIDHPNAGLVSRDRHSALVQFDVKGEAENAKDKIAPILAAIDGAQAGNPSVIIEEFGQASADYEVTERFGSDMHRAELTSLPLTIGILVVAFGALVAAGLPVLLAFSAVLAATGLNSLVSHVVPTDEQTLSAIILMIGMAVGIDYSLFYLRREREERYAGRSPHDALLYAARTSGQAVLISGATVLIAMAGMFVSGNSLFTTIGLGTMIVVLAAMIGSLTVLPAVLDRLGDNVDWGRIPLLRGRPRDDGPWGRFIGGVLRRPLLSMLVSGGALLVLALPALTMHTKLPNLTDLPHDLKIVRTYDRIQQAFPGSQTPAVVVVQRAERRHAADAEGLRPVPGARARDRRALRAVHGQPEPGPHRRPDRLRDRRQRRQRGVGLGAPHAPRHGDPADREDAAGHRGGGDRRDRRHLRLQPPDAGAAPVRLPVRARPGVLAPAAHVQVARDRDDGGGAQPALGRRRLRDPRRGLPARLVRRACSASRRTARSSAGCRSSCSSSCSASRWTTTSSSSAA